MRPFHFIKLNCNFVSQERRQDFVNCCGSKCVQGRARIASLDKGAKRRASGWRPGLHLAGQRTVCPIVLQLLTQELALADLGAEITIVRHFHAHDSRSWLRWSQWSPVCAAHRLAPLRGAATPTASGAHLARTMLARQPGGGALLSWRHFCPCPWRGHGERVGRTVTNGPAHSNLAAARLGAGAMD